MSSETLTPQAVMSPAERAALADRVAASTLACSGVAGLHAGPHGTAATHLPGRVVLGVRVLGRTVSVHVVMRWGARASDVAARVRAAVEALGGVDEVRVMIEDVELPSERLPAPERAGEEVVVVMVVEDKDRSAP